ncbi:MAG TPA: hypothetical protein VIC53_02090 [Wenzhouxiangella sp.]
MKFLNEDTLTEGSHWLEANDPRFKQVFEITGPLAMRRKPAGFSGLLGSIVSQQLSTAAAKTIWQRLIDAKLDAPDAILESDDQTLRSVGLSQQKIRYARALAHAKIDYDHLPSCNTEEVIDVLVGVTGIGRWTAQMYALFSLGHLDVFAPNDLALQEGLRMLAKQRARPTPKEADAMAQPWSPWRSVASLALWSFYSKQTTRTQ